MANKQYSLTYTDLLPYHFEWRIRDFSARRDAGLLKDLHSEPFQVKIGDDTANWKIEIHYPTVSLRFNRHTDYLSFFLKYYAAPNGRKQYLIRNDSYRLKSCSGEDYAMYSHGTTVYQKDGMGYPLFIRMAELEPRKHDLLPNDTMTLICRGDILLGVEVKYTTPALAIKASTISVDYQELLESGVGSDVTLVSQGKEIAVHRVVLQDRSPVFAAMFTHDTLEKHTGKIVIKDLDPAVLQAMVYFLYTDQEPPNLPVVAMDLFMAADKYDLTRLKTMCEKHLADTLNLLNVIPRLQYAIVRNCNQLADICLCYAKSHMNILVNSPSWANVFLSEYSEARLALSNLEGIQV